MCEMKRIELDGKDAREINPRSTPVEFVVVRDSWNYFRLFHGCSQMLMNSGICNYVFLAVLTQ